MRTFILYILFSIGTICAAYAQYRPGGIDPIVWLDAGAGVTVVGSGDNNVVTWADQSGNGRNTTGSNPNQPNLTVNGMGTGLSSIRFTTANADRLSFANSALINNLAISQRLLTLAFTPNGVTTRQVLYEHGNTNSGMSLYILSGSLYAGVWWGTGTTQRIFTNLSISNSAPHIASLSFNSAGNLVLYLDGVASTSVAAGSNTTVANTSVASLGAVNTSIRYHDGTSPTGNGAAPFNGDIAEMVLLNDASQNKRVLIENFLAQKYGVSLGANDKFVPSPSVYAQMVGIGQESATDLLTSTTYNSNGLFMMNAPTLPFIQDNGDYVIVANNAATGFTTVGTAGRYLNRLWTVDVTNAGGGIDNFITLKFDVVVEGGNMPIYGTVSDYYIRIDGIPTYAGQAYIEGNRVCFTVAAVALDGKKITLGTNFGATYTAYQPGGADRCVMWLDASNGTQKVTGTTPITLWDDASSNVANNFDGIPPGAATPGTAPNFSANYFGTNLNSITFDATTRQYLRMNNVTSGINALTGLTYNNKMIIGFIRPTTVTTATGFQMLFEQGDSLHGMNIYADLTAKNLYVGAWRNKGSDFNLFLNTPLTNNNTTNYLVTSVFDRAGSARFRLFRDGTMMSQTPITGVLPILPHNNTALDNVGIGAIRAGTRYHTNAAGTDPTNTGGFADAALGEIVEYNDNSNALRRIVESYFAKKYGQTIAGNVYAGANAFEPVGIGMEAVGDVVSTTDLPSTALYLESGTFPTEAGDYLMTANNNTRGTALYSVNGFTWLRNWDVTVTDAAPTTGGTVTLSFSIDRDGSDRTLYTSSQYFIYDVTAAVPIAGTLGTATTAGTSPDRLVKFTVNVSAIAGKRITLGVANSTIPVECNCFDGVDSDSDGLSDTNDPDCQTKWRCDGSFTFSEFTPGGSPTDYTRFRVIQPTYVPFALDDYATTDLQRKFNATAYYRNDSLVYGIVAEGADVNKLFRVRRDGTVLDMGVPIGNTGITFPNGAAGFRAAGAMVRTNSSPASAIAKLVLANNSTNAASGAAKRIAILDINAFSQPRVITYNGLTFTDAAGTPDFTDLEFDPTIATATAQAYAYDRGRKLLIRITVAGTVANIGQCTAVAGAVAQPYDNVDALFFDEFGELYGYATPTGSGGATTLVHINKTNGTITAISANGTTGQTLDGCMCSLGITMRVTPVDAGNIPITTAYPNTTVRYRVELINRSQTSLTGLSVAENFPDGRTFTAISYISVFTPTPTVTGLGTSSISVTNISVGANSTATFILDVFVPLELESSTITIQPTATNMPINFGTSRRSDYGVTTTALRDATPLIISAPLPVVWASFDAYRSGEDVQLEWATFEEKNNAYFQVERSADNIFWEELTRTPAAVNSNELQSYAAIDGMPLMGKNYYRIKQVDMDGAYSYTETMSVRFEADNALSLRVFPNPTTDNDAPTLTFFAAKATQRYEIRLMDLQGRILFAQEIAAAQGSNTLSLPMAGLAQGVYLLQVSSEDATATEKIFIQ